MNKKIGLICVASYLLQSIKKENSERAHSSVSTIDGKSTLAYYTGIGLKPITLRPLENKCITIDSKSDHVFKTSMLMTKENLTNVLEYRQEKDTYNAYGLIPTFSFFDEWVKGINQYGNRFNPDVIVQKFNGVETPIEKTLMQSDGLNGMIPFSFMSYKDNTTILYTAYVENVEKDCNGYKISLLLPLKHNFMESRKLHPKMIDKLHTHSFLAEKTTHGNGLLEEGKDLKLERWAFHAYGAGEEQALEAAGKL